MNPSTTSLCRICLGNSATIPIFEASRNGSDSTIQNKLSLCLSQKLEDVEGYPRYICNNCQVTLNIAFDFINKYKETCKVLEKKLHLLVKEENIEFDDNNYFDHPKNDTVETKPTKKEVKIEFDDGPNLLEKIKPLCKLNTNRKSKSKQGTPIKRKTNLVNKEIAKKPHTNLNSIQKLKKIKSSLLEGEFVWNAEDWCAIKPSNREIKDETLKIKSPALAEKVKEISHNLSKPEQKSLEPVLCETCGETFDNQMKLKLHEEKKHKNLSTCPKCNMTLSSTYYLTRHIKRIHSGVKNFVCSSCEKAFAYEKDLNSHIKVVHKRIGIRVIKRVPCKFCDKDFCNKSSLRVHVRAVHTGERPAVCKVCDASFFGDEYLRQHMRLHTGECPHKCPVCGRGYSQSCNMKSHMRNHRISELDQETLSKIKPSWHKFMKP